jgi:PIN domain nuclease of toxin-antitoxin system
MSRFVLDASAVLAFLNQEKGCQVVENHLSTGLISTVNFSEVISVLISLGASHHEAAKMLDGIFGDIVPFDKEQAELAAELREHTKPFGLSLGDRACLALAKAKKLKVLTADTQWSKLKLNVDIQLIR